MMKHAFFLLFLIPFALSAQTYTRNYEVNSSDKTVGNIVAKQLKDGENITYEVNSDVSIRMLFMVNVSYKVTAVYREGVLINSTATVYLNGRTQDKVSVAWQGNGYTVVKDGESSRIDGLIKWSSAKLYFNKPKDVKKVFSETDGGFKNLITRSDGKLILRDVDNESSQNTYTFSSEQGLHRIEIERPLLPILTVKNVRVAPEIDN
jgi:hypothetical protein